MDEKKRKEKEKKIKEKKKKRKGGKEEPGTWMKVEPNNSWVMEKGDNKASYHIV